MTGAQAKQALERSTPYVSIGNLIALATLLVMGVQTGLLDVSAGADPAGQQEVDDIAARVSNNTSSISELRRINDRQDEALAATQDRVSHRMKRVEGKVDRIYELLVERGGHPGEQRP